MSHANDTQQALSRELEGPRIRREKKTVQHMIALYCGRMHRSQAQIAHAPQAEEGVPTSAPGPASGPAPAPGPTPEPAPGPAHAPKPGPGSATRPAPLEAADSAPGLEGKRLCRECEDLLTYALKRLTYCRFGENKTTCAACPVHCYAPEPREAIRKVMRYAGPRMLWTHPVLTVRHLIDGRTRH
ncbi:nitrous oxide-stimulated promoter family protein [Paenibacillus sp. alder61]|uniref:nitrous oxide-stimulated promoter family protein n=1 Tax=Paenibacillus sp. alder61 TaxID=2862948 RepID=UPI001CD6BCAC|nr:nitrous oxide-stimulated promoter family protein [Paenibacillus sp. alder61]MCA1293333.1 nitrous oxide-stimulated promoter family protein [Paenibacillus sp. alder61]